jgi:hypothetical protein
MSATIPKYTNIQVRNTKNNNSYNTLPNHTRQAREARLAGPMLFCVALVLFLFEIQICIVVYFGVVAHFDCCLGDARHKLDELWRVFYICVLPNILILARCLLTRRRTVPRHPDFEAPDARNHHNPLNNNMH